MALTHTIKQNKFDAYFTHNLANGKNADTFSRILLITLLVSKICTWKNINVKAMRKLNKQTFQLMYNLYKMKFHKEITLLE